MAQNQLPSTVLSSALRSNRERHGGQDIGTIWGHRTYVASDWSADYLHRQSLIVLDRWAKQLGFASYSAMSAESRAALQGRLTEVTRHNTYNAATDRSCSTGKQGNGNRRHKVLPPQLAHIAFVRPGVRAMAKSMNVDCPSMWSLDWRAPHSPYGECDAVE